LIKPHGSDSLNALLIENETDRKRLLDNAVRLPTLMLNSAAAANLVMLGAGYFNPLKGFMGPSDALSICESLHTTSGLFWPVPVINLVRDKPSFGADSKIALLDPNVDGHPIMAVMEVSAVERVTDEQLCIMSAEIFGTEDSNHPGVATFNGLGHYLISGDVQVLSLSYFQADFAPSITV